MCMTLVRNSCSTDLEGDIYLLSRALSSLAFIELFLRMLINKQGERKVVQCIFIRKQPWTIFEQKKGKIAFDRSQSQAPRPHWWNRKLHRLFQNSSPCFHIFSIFASALVLNVRYMFYTDKCHLVRTTNIAKFNYNEIPYAYTTSFGKY